MLSLGSDPQHPNPDVQTRLTAMFAEAVKRNLVQQLVRQLNYLDGYANGPGQSYESADRTGTCCCFYVDSDPLSLGITMRRWHGGQYENWWAGGLIFSGKGSQPGWSVNT